MSKYGEMRALFEMAFEMANKANTKPKTPHKLGRSLKKKDLDFDPFELLQKEKERVARFEQRVKDWDKLNKKEGKNDDKKRSFFGIEWYVIGLVSYPLFMYISQLPGMK
jgi:hypothetical protein